MMAVVNGVLAALFAGLAAYWLARGVGIPGWTAWVPGDAADIGVFTGWAVWLLIGAVRR